MLTADSRLLTAESCPPPARAIDKGAAARHSCWPMTAAFFYWFYFGFRAFFAPGHPGGVREI
jgi:hypothetical protein